MSKGGIVFRTSAKLLLSNKNQIQYQAQMRSVKWQRNFSLNKSLFLCVFVKTELNSYNFSLSRVLTNRFIN